MGEEEQNQEQDIGSIIEKCNELKQKGNTSFQEKDYQKALKNYHRIVMYLKSYVGENDQMSQYSKLKLKNDQKKQVDDILVIVYQNMSQCHLNQQNYHRARDCAEDALKIRISEKALYRKAWAQIQIGEIDDAQQCVLKLQQLNKDADLKDLLNKIKIIQNQNDLEAQKMYKKMF